jgi:hypothetical protein
MGLGMRFDEKKPPRRYQVGNAVKFEISDCGTIHLNPDEQVTFATEGGRELDVTRKSWGFYATPSLNGRLEQFGLRGVLIQNTKTLRYFIFLVEKDRMEDYQKYMDEEGLAVVAWLDSSESLDKLKKAMQRAVD